jgi:hypothetical protein
MVILSIFKIHQPAVPKSKAAFTSNRLKAANKKDLYLSGKGLARNVMVANIAGEG